MAAWSHSINEQTYKRTLKAYPVAGPISEQTCARSPKDEFSRMLWISQIPYGDIHPTSLAEFR